MAAPAQSDPDFVADTVRRSLPNRDRPRLSTQNEQTLEPLERRCAIQYADMETVTEDLKRLSAVLADDGRAVPDEIFKDEEDSLVVSINELPISKAR